MPSFDDLSLFVSVCDAGGLAAAETATGRRRSTLSRAVQRLEAEFGTALARRTPQAFRLTPEGERFLPAAQAALNQVARMHALAAPFAAVKLVKITAPTLFAQTVLPAAIARYRSIHPTARVLVDTSNRKLDLAESGFDLAVRVGDPNGVSNIARTLMQTRWKLYSAPDTVHLPKETDDPSMLADGPTVVVTQTERINADPSWSLVRDASSAKVVLRSATVVDDMPTCARIAEAGAGVALLPDFYAERLCREGRLQALLPDWSTPPLTVRLIFGAGRDTSPEIRALADEIVQAARVVHS